MSVVAFNPRSKRLFEDDTENEQEGQHTSPVKRARCNGSPAGAYFGSRLPSSTAWPAGPSGVHPDTFNALKSLFPGMDDQVWLIP